MLIQKTFHLHMLKEAAKARLENLAEYRRQLANVETAVLMADGGAHFVFRAPWGFRADVELIEVPGVNPAQTLFRSRRGNVEVLGVLEYFQIRPNLTEVVLTLDYTIMSPLFRLLDHAGSNIDRFLNLQLERLENFFTQPADVERNAPEPLNHHQSSG